MPSRQVHLIAFLDVLKLCYYPFKCDSTWYLIMYLKLWYFVLFDYFGRSKKWWAPEDFHFIWIFTKITFLYNSSSPIVQVDLWLLQNLEYHWFEFNIAYIWEVFFLFLSYYIITRIIQLNFFEPVVISGVLLFNYRNPYIELSFLQNYTIPIFP